MMSTLKYTAILLLAIIMALHTTPLVHAVEGELDAIPLELGATQWGITVDGDLGEWGTFTCPTLPVGGNYGVYYYVTVNNIPSGLGAIPSETRGQTSQVSGTLITG